MNKASLLQEVICLKNLFNDSETRFSQVCSLFNTSIILQQFYVVEEAEDCLQL